MGGLVDSAPSGRRPAVRGVSASHRLSVLLGVGIIRLCNNLPVVVWIYHQGWEWFACEDVYW